MKWLVINMFQHRGLEVDLCAAWRIFVGRPAGFFALGRAQILSLFFDVAKIQHLHCGLRIFHKKFSKFFLSRTEKVDMGVVIWSFGHLSKSKTGKVKIGTIIINIKYLFYSEQMTAFPKSKMTK